MWVGLSQTFLRVVPAALLSGGAEGTAVKAPHVRTVSEVAQPETCSGKLRRQSPPSLVSCQDEDHITAFLPQSGESQREKGKDKIS